MLIAAKHFHLNHYFLIDEFTPTLKRKTNKVDKDDRVLNINLDPLLTYYDTETIYSCGVGEEHLVMPYAVSYITTDINNIEIIRDTTLTDKPGFQTFDSMLSENLNLAKRIIEADNHKIIPFKHGKSVHAITIYMIAYNGANFDHWMLFRHIMSKGFKCVVAPNNKANTMKFILYFNVPEHGCDQNSIRNKKGEIYGKVFLEVWDPCQFLCSQLSAAADDFKLPFDKLEYDHIAIQHAYAEGKLKEYLDEHSVINYIMRDVELLREVSVRFRNACITALKLDPINSPTMASFSWKKFTSMTTSSNIRPIPWKHKFEEHSKVVALTTEDMIRKYPDYMNKASVYQGRILKHETEKAEYDMTEKGQDYVRTSVVAGRVEGVIGEHIPETDSPMHLVDVCSLYPSVMKNNRYPTGDPTFIYETDENSIKFRREALYDPRYIGLYHCRYDPKNLIAKTGYPYLPIRGDTLKWDSESVLKAGIIEGLLPDVTIRDLIALECPIEFTSPSDPMLPNSIIWGVSTDTFDGYINLCSKIKTDEDDKPDHERNHAMRKTGKLGLNSIFGKALQKMYGTKFVVYVKDEIEKARSDYSQDVAGGYIPSIELIAKNFMLVKRENLSSKVYPIHLSVFILAYARKSMYDNIFSKAHLFHQPIYYTDTDSAIICAAFYDYLVANGFILQKGEKNVIGKFTHDGIIIRLIVAAPKFYGFIELNGKITIKIKGVRGNDKYLLEGGLLSVKGEDGMRLLTTKLKGEMVQISTFAFYRDKGKLKHRNVVKNL